MWNKTPICLPTLFTQAVSFLKNINLAPNIKPLMIWFYVTTNKGGNTGKRKKYPTVFALCSAQFSCVTPEANMNKEIAAAYESGTGNPPGDQRKRESSQYERKSRIVTVTLLERGREKEGRGKRDGRTPLAEARGSSWDTSLQRVLWDLFLFNHSYTWFKGGKVAV